MILNGILDICSQWATHAFDEFRLVTRSYCNVKIGKTANDTLSTSSSKARSSGGKLQCSKSWPMSIQDKIITGYGENI